MLSVPYRIRTCCAVAICAPPDLLFRDTICITSMTAAQDLSTRGRPYRMSKRAAQAATTRQRILDAARAALRDGTYHDATIEELAVRAGVTRVTVYRTFGNKPALLQALTWD